MKALFFSLLIIFTFSSCLDKTEDEFNDVFIRLENLTGVELTDIFIGKRYEKQSGYRYVDYSTEFSSLKNNELTEFFNTQGQYNGYNNLRAHTPSVPIEWVGWRKDEREAELLLTGAFEDMWENPFTENLLDGLSLPEGDYTYKITLNEDGSDLIVDIVKE